MQPKPKRPPWFDAERHAPAVIDPVANFSIRVDSSEARRASTWLDEAGSARGIPADPLLRLDLCVTEALANVIAHGGAGPHNSGLSAIRLSVSTEGVCTARY